MTIANGLRVVLVHDPRAAEVQVTMRYGVGGADDPADAPGMAHLVEHLMYQQVVGTETVFAHLEDDTTYFNGETTWDATTYVERAQPAHLAELLELEAVRLGSRCTTVDASAFAREREVVLNELRERGAVNALYDALDGGVYPAGHPYRRSVGGSEQTVGAITRDQACAFADAHYAPGNAVLVVSGDLTIEQLEAALQPFTHLDRRPAAAAAPVPPVEGGRTIEVNAPAGDDALVLAWPLPRDPAQRIRVRAVVTDAAAAIDDAIAGSVRLITLGDTRAPLLGVYVVPGRRETYQAVLDAARNALTRLPAALTRDDTLGDLTFDELQQTALYQLFARLQDGGSRDARLAADVLAGRDPHEVLDDEFEALRTMTRDDAAQVAGQELTLERAIVVHLVGHGEARSGHAVELGAPIHDVGERRDPPDPALAHQPFANAPATQAFAGMRTRRLANGLRVVLLPLTTVPTVDIRLVFGAGTGDEPAGARGAALLAGYALSWDFQYFNDMLRFIAAGGLNLVSVGPDGTTFEARGLDMHLDLLLAGLRRWVRDGRYNGTADAYATAMQRQGKRTDDAGALTDAWRAALFGRDHPYVDAGLVRHVSNVLGADDATRFRAAFYTPDNATLVIAGHFDPELADQWIEYLFADWTGHADARSSPPGRLAPESLAGIADTAQVELRVAMRAGAGDRARQLVAAAMLGGIAEDVRHQLGASYDLAAHLEETRLETDYAIDGWIEAPRVADAVKLLRDRIAQLRADPAAAASAFVIARAHVIDQLLAASGSAAELAERVTRDVELQRPPMSDLATARAVERLTIDDMTGALADLDLTHAAILMRGPAGAITDGFGVLGRTPSFIRDAGHDAEDPNARPQTPRRGDDESFVHFADALTDQGPPSSWALEVTTGYASATLGDHGATGVTVSGALVERFTTNDAAGFLASIGYESGSYAPDMGFGTPRSLEILPIDLAGVAQATAFDRLWGSVQLGLHLDHVIDNDVDAWHAGIGAGLEGGVDIFRHGPHRFGVFARVQGELLATPTYVAFTGGLTYRR